jgi:hypothetical protein
MVRIAARQDVELPDIAIENIHDGARAGGAGGSNDILLVSASIPVRLNSLFLSVFMGGTYTVRVRASLRNEDFDGVTVPTLTTTSTTSTTYTTSTTTTTTTTTTTPPAP